MSSAHSALSICYICGSVNDGYVAFAFLSLTEL